MTGRRRDDSTHIDILDPLRQNPRGMTDEELAAALGLELPEIVRRFRRLAFQGIVIREQGPDGQIVNKLDHGASDGRLYFEDQISIHR